MGIHDGHRERLQKRFDREGLDDFESVNALELLLFFTHKRADTNTIAHRLLERFGSFSLVLDAPRLELVKIEGVGPMSALLIKLTHAMAGYYLQDKVAKTVLINTAEIAGNFFIPKFLGKNNEIVYLALLDDRRHLMRAVKIFEGSVNMSAIVTKKVMEEVVTSNATGVILAHNHPGGIAIPSSQDIIATSSLFKSLKIINVKLLDHIVVANDDFVSMADSGMFQSLE